MILLAFALACFGLLAFLSLFTVVSPYEVLLNLIDKEVMFAVSLSLLTAAASTAIVLVLAVPTAYALSKEFRGRIIVESVLTLPNALTPVAVGATLLIFFSRTPMGKIIDSVVPIVFSIPGLIVAQAVVSFPLALKPLKAAMKELSNDTILMMRTLGCNDICLVRKVVIPSIKRSLASAASLVFTRSLSEFGASVTLAGAIRYKTETLPIAIYLNLNSGDIVKAIALITLASIMAFVLLWLSAGWEK